MASLSGATTSRTLLDIIPQYSKSKIEVGSVRLKSIVSVGNAQNATSRFPKLEECAHFHYDHVDLQPIQPVMSLPQLLVTQEDCPRGDFEGITLKVTSGNETWQVRRTYEHFCKLDEQLHQCVFDRKFSKLPVLCQQSPNSNAEVLELLNRYVKRLSVIGSGCAISCGPVLSWFEIDNRGRRLVAAGHGINTPAVAAAFATTPYTAHATDELSFQIGDMISVIDMPPAEESSWWRGKRGFVVGFFPSNCVAVITDKIPHEIAIAEPNKPVLRKHGKLIAFFRAFILSRPSRRRLKQSGILKERVFGCDLSEHLLNSGREIPLVLKCCAEFIEAHGIVDGIYRLSGVTSNIQRLRSIFDEDRVPVLEEDSGIKQDIHGVASLLKMYFRELPNPLCTYQLYDEFVAAVQSPLDQRLEKMRNVVQKLPPPHYRTLKYLMGHLGRVCGHSTGTGMTARNVAIVWAPNLLRCRSLDQGVAALQGVGVQAVVTEFLILYSPAIFGENVHLRPKSLAVNSPTKLLSLEEAQARGQSSPIQPYVPPEVATTERASSEPNYHTVIELPRKRQPLNWRTIFTPRRSNLQVKSPRRLKMKTAVKSAEFLGCGSGGVLVCTPLPVSGPPTSTHSRSVSHDSYFDTAAIDHHRSSSSLVETQHEGLSLSLDLSELQMNFDTEESEMRIFSEDETNQLFSSGASIAFGVLESCESNLEQRFSNQELRFIDSYSPDAMESPSDEDAFSPPGGGGGVNYRALTTPSSSGDNNNVGGAVLSAGTASSSRRSVEISPFSYEKLADTPSVTEKKENDLYESCVPSGRHTYETMELETEAYEPVSTAPQTSSHLYQNEEMVKSAQEDLDQNIYEDVQQCTPPADIYEQVSNFRNSVNEVNRLVVDNNSPSSSAEEKTEMKKEFSIYVDIDKENREDLAKEYDGRGEEGERAKRSDYEVVSFTSGRENVVPAKQNEIKNKPDDDKADCDSKLSVFRDNIETAPVTICEVLDKSSVEETIKKTSPSKPACSVISEVLKRDWVGRSKDTSSSQKPVPPSSLPLVKTEEDDFGKTEKLRKIFERGSACAKSPVNEAQQRLSPLSVEAIIKEELMKNPQGSESEAERRERIEKYKEERRNFFRNKYKTDTLNNNEDRDDDLIRRIKQRTKVKERSDESLGGQISPTMRRRSSVETDSKKSPTKVTVNISYSPTKSKAPSEMGVSPVERRRADSLPLRERRRDDSFK